MEDIILGGVSLNALIEMKASMAKEAVKFVAVNIEAAKQLVKEIIEEYQEEDYDYNALDAKAEKAYNILSHVNIVSKVTGVTYSLGWSGEYSGNDEDVLSEELNDLDYDEDKELSPMTYKLMRLLEDMECTAQGWEDSTC